MAMLTTKVPEQWDDWPAILDTVQDHVKHSDKTTVLGFHADVFENGHDFGVVLGQAPIETFTEIGSSQSGPLEGVANCCQLVGIHQVLVLDIPNAALFHGSVNTNGSW